MAQPKFTDMSSVNKWWAKSMDKERSSMTNAPKSPKSNKWLVPEEFSHLAPELRKRKGHASR